MLGGAIDSIEGAWGSEAAAEPRSPFLLVGRSLAGDLTAAPEGRCVGRTRVNSEGVVPKADPEGGGMV